MQNACLRFWLILRSTVKAHLAIVREMFFLKSIQMVEGQCALVCGRLAEFVLAQLSGAHDARRATS